MQDIARPKQDQSSFSGIRRVKVCRKRRLRTTYLFTCFSMFSLFFLRACKMAQPRSRIMRRSDTDVARLTDRGKRGKHKDPKRTGSHRSHRITKTKLLRRTRPSCLCLCLYLPLTWLWHISLDLGLIVPSKELLFLSIPVPSGTLDTHHMFTPISKMISDCASRRGDHWRSLWMPPLI